MVINQKTLMYAGAIVLGYYGYKYLTREESPSSATKPAENPEAKSNVGGQTGVEGQWATCRWTDAQGNPRVEYTRMSDIGDVETFVSNCQARGGSAAFNVMAQAQGTDLRTPSNQGQGLGHGRVFGRGRKRRRRAHGTPSFGA
jgi:hypothetical protein